MSNTLLSLCSVLAIALPVVAQTDLVIYGGTASGVAAAVQAARMGKTVTLLEPGTHIGGLTSGGLGYTDSGNKAVIGGISREFYQRVKKHYRAESAWTFGKPADLKSYHANDDAMWVFEPKVAEQILRAMLAEHKITPIFNARLVEKTGVTMDGPRIASIRMENGQSYAGTMFIDATYEGDLMAQAKVSFTVGREANDKYGETLNGIAVKWQTHNHRFIKNVSPFVVAGDPKSGLLPGIEPGPLPPDGTGDHRLQAYCFRMCMSLDPDNRVPFPKPEGYDEKEYELLFRNFEAGDLRIPMKPDMMPNGKTDTNNNFAVSTDYIGANYAYPEASYAERETIIKKHEVYQKGLMWSLQNHPRVPEKVRAVYAKWGLPKDEFTDNSGWPHQIYVREARRMVSDYVQTETDCRRKRETPHSVGMGSYAMDSHNCCRYVTKEGFVQNEGDVQEGTGGPYRISYQSIVPKKGECANLFVPVCVSSSHIAYGSIRMEPVFMILGQSAATAASLAIDAKSSVQDVDMAKLRERLLADKQVLEFNAPPKASGKEKKKLEGIVVDDDDAKLTGFSTKSSASAGFIGEGYRHDGDSDKGEQSAIYTATIPEAGTYEVRLYFPPNANRASNVPVTVASGSESQSVTVNQKTLPSEGYVLLTTMRCEKGPATVTIRTTGTTGYVVIDAVQWLKK